MWSSVLEPCAWTIACMANFTYQTGCQCANTYENAIGMLCSLEVWRFLNLTDSCIADIGSNRVSACASDYTRHGVIVTHIVLNRTIRGIHVVKRSGTLCLDHCLYGQFHISNRMPVRQHL